MKKCLFQIISQTASKEGLAFMEQYEKGHPEHNFRDCKGCTGYPGYTKCEDKNYNSGDANEKRE